MSGGPDPAVLAAPEAPVTARGRTPCDYSIVIPVYANEACLVPLFQSLKSEVIDANPNLAGEIVFVDDGSEDGSFEVLRRISHGSPCPITIIRLSRNFGQAGALLAGYERAAGRCVITISADGQEPPSLVNEMLRGFFDEGCEIVICARVGRDESQYRSITSRLYFSSMRLLTFKRMPKGGFDVWLMGRRALEVFLRNPDANPSFQWRVLWMGFKTKQLEYRRRARLAGVSRFTFRKKIDAVLDGLLGFSVIPIRVIWLTGCAFVFAGMAYGAWLALDRLVRGNPPEAWAFVVLLLLIMGGLQMGMLGLVGEYVWRTLAQVHLRDPYVIDAVFTSDDP